MKAAPGSDGKIRRGRNCLPRYQRTMKYLHINVKRKGFRFKIFAWCSNAHPIEHSIEWNIVLIPLKQRGRLISTLSTQARTY